MPAAAQDNFWVQVEARQSASSTQDRAREFAARLDNVAAFYLADGFYGIFIGPFDATGAEAELARLLAAGAIPADSFVKNGQYFQDQVWPIGGAAPAPAPVVQPEPTPTVRPTPRPTIVTETTEQADAFITLNASIYDPEDPQLEEARRAENALSTPERQKLQRALHWAGVFDGENDGDFAEDTRLAMQAWQEAEGLPVTGILTEEERATLIAAYDAPLEGMNMRLVRDAASGIQMQIPINVVAFTEYQPPFVRFDASGDIPEARVLFISQPGDLNVLTQLYEVMQILDFMPAEGPRHLANDGFEIEGAGEKLHSHISVTLRDGGIKGFILIWPAGDDARRTRILEEMRLSFQWLDGVLDPNVVTPASEETAITGLSIREPRLSRAGFYVSEDGAAITTTEVIESCERITFDRETEARVVFTDTDLGLALLRPITGVTPAAIAGFDIATPDLRDRIAVAGYPFNGVRSAPTLTYGEVMDAEGLAGDTRFNRVSVLSRAGDAGGPMLDETGALRGMLVPRPAGSDGILPAEVNFALNARTIAATLDVEGIVVAESADTDTLSPVALTRAAEAITVLVSCW